MKLHGIGIDILDIKRIEPLKGQYNDPFFMKSYTDKERLFSINSKDPILSFSIQFSCKESIFKSLNIDPDSIQLNQFETDISHNPFYAKLSGESLQSLDLKIKVSYKIKDNIIITKAEAYKKDQQ